MWVVLIIIIAAIAIFYSNDKSDLKKKVVSTGGLNQIFRPFIECIENDFTGSKLLKMTDTEIEVSTLSVDGQSFVFGIKLGFGNKVNYRCDTKSRSFLNADIAVVGNVSNQVQSYQMILNELILKYDISLS